MTSAHTLFILNQGRSLKRLAAKGKLSATALAAAGGAIMAASTAQAQSKSKIADDAAVVNMDAASGDSVVVGQGLVGATHTHASGLQHNHGPCPGFPMAFNTRTRSMPVQWPGLWAWRSLVAERLARHTTAR